MATELDDDTLQRYYDGDLSPLEASAVRNRIDHDAEARQRLVRVGNLSKMLAAAGEELGQDLDSAALFADIQRDIQRNEAASFGERLHVITDEWSEHRRGVVVAIGAVAAIAAAALLGVLSPGADEIDSQARNMPPPREEQKTRIAEAPLVPAPHGSQIENVDFGNNTGTVFEVEHAGVTTAVVWIADDEEDAP